ncbi:hypothetical protein [Riemerella columbipharyngis]|uniref:Uncharacterized protein n=1 Tax=Riemerella columbipharyngis TaxID=1071918 RepID=A0A1G7B7D7_9FLAO|nr:hypothetical protein SAMN05421544_10550 [Riemerella columbipharyngis]
MNYKVLTDEDFQILRTWYENYNTRLNKNIISAQESLALMQQSNPKFILRNYMLYESINELNEDKTEILDKLITALETPYIEIYPEFSTKRPRRYDNTTGCSMLSYSS